MDRLECIVRVEGIAFPCLVRLYGPGGLLFGEVWPVRPTHRDAVEFFGVPAGRVVVRYIARTFEEFTIPINVTADCPAVVAVENREPL